MRYVFGGISENEILLVRTINFKSRIKNFKGGIGNFKGGTKKAKNHFLYKIKRILERRI
jgi:hypothetical protein